MILSVSLFRQNLLKLRHISLSQDFSKSVALGGGIKFMYRINIGQDTVASCNGARGAVTESLILSGGETCRVLGRPDQMTVERDAEVKSSDTNPNALGVKISYKNGDSCNPSSGQKRETVVRIECDQSMKPSSSSSVRTATTTTKTNDIVVTSKRTPGTHRSCR